MSVNSEKWFYGAEDPDAKESFIVIWPESEMSRPVMNREWIACMYMGDGERETKASIAEESARIICKQHNAALRSAKE